jgi:hypothetical protein
MSMADEGTTKIVNKKQFLALLKDADQKKTRVASINGELGERIKEASESGHLHRQLFGLMLKLSRQDELRRNDFLAQFPIYVEMCRDGGIFGQEHAGDLVADAEKAAAKEEDADAAAVEKNAKAIENGIGELKEDGDASKVTPIGKRKGGVGEAPGSYKLQ